MKKLLIALVFLPLSCFSYPGNGPYPSTGGSGGGGSIVSSNTIAVLFANTNIIYTDGIYGNDNLSGTNIFSPIQTFDLASSVVPIGGTIYNSFDGTLFSGVYTSGNILWTNGYTLNLNGGTLQWTNGGIKLTSGNASILNGTVNIAWNTGGSDFAGPASGSYTGNFYANNVTFQGIVNGVWTNQDIFILSAAHVSTGYWWFQNCTFLSLYDSFNTSHHGAIEFDNCAFKNISPTSVTGQARCISIGGTAGNSCVLNNDTMLCSNILSGTIQGPSACVGNKTGEQTFINGGSYIAIGTNTWTFYAAGSGTTNWISGIANYSFSVTNDSGSANMLWVTNGWVQLPNGFINGAYTNGVLDGQLAGTLNNLPSPTIVSNPTNAFTTNVIYSVTRSGVLQGDMILQETVGASAQCAIQYTNGGTGYYYAESTPSGVLFNVSRGFTLRFPANTTFIFNPTSAYITNTVYVQDP